MQHGVVSPTAWHVGADAADHQGERQQGNRQIESKTDPGQQAELEEGGNAAHLHQPDAGLSDLEADQQPSRQQHRKQGWLQPRGVYGVEVASVERAYGD